jgi:hypothetical protein
LQKIIGVCGLIGSGKGTIANILVNDYDFVELSFSNLLKDVTATAFNWPRHLLQGDTAESREWREQPDSFWTSELNKEVTPRLALQLLGTECFRNGFHEDFWTLSVKKIILDNPEINYVISDARFTNEKNLIKSLGGEIWHVKKGVNPTWFSAAISDNNFDTTIMKDFHANIHISEWAWIDFADTFNLIITNDGSISDLKTGVNAIMKEIK